MNLRYASTFEALPCDVYTDTVEGEAMDAKDYFGLMKLSLISSAASTGDTLNAKVEESDDGEGDWTDVAGAVWTEVDDQADAFQTISFNIDNCKRFIRIVGTLAGGTISMSFGVVGIGFVQHQSSQ